MSSRITLKRRKLGDQINELGFVAMVACRRCQKQRLPCKMSSLNERCGHCVRSGCYECEPGDLARVNFNAINKERARLRALEVEAKKEDAEAMERSRLARAKLDRVWHQQEFLKSREEKMFNEGLKSVEEMEALEAVAKLAEDIQRAEVERSASSAEGGVAQPLGVTGEENVVGDGLVGPLSGDRFSRLGSPLGSQDAGWSAFLDFDGTGGV